MDKFNLNPLSFLLLIAVPSIIINQGVDALDSPSQGSHFSVTINEDENTLVRNPGIQRKHPKHRYRFDPSTEFTNNLRRRESRLPDVTRVQQTINPPPYEEVAKMARFIVRNSMWTSMATISSRAPTVGSPFASILSVSDGPENGTSTGIPYMYLTPFDESVIDLKQNPKAALTMTLAQGDYCRLHDFDPEDPRCAHIMLTGTIVKIDNSTREAIFAREAIFTRHPQMNHWPTDHGWFFAKLNIENIVVRDYFGGAQSVTPEEYFQAGAAERYSAREDILANEFSSQKMLIN